MQKFKKIDQYQLMEIIGKGANGLVYKGLNITDGSLVAIKELFIGKSQVKAIKTQLDLLKKLEHPLIVKFIDAIQKQNKIYLVLQYMEGGSLGSLVRKSVLEEDVAKIYVKQILNGLVFLHKKQVIHRDIKGANILLTKNGLIKLADFGVAVKLQENQKTISAAGSPYWMAPEIISSGGDQPTYKCDIWSLGCTVIELLTGNPPYYDLMQFPALFRIVQDKHPPIPECSAACKQFLLACFNKNPKQRPSAQQLLNYSWLKSTNEFPSNLLQQQQKINKEISQALKPNINYPALQKLLKNTRNCILLCNHKYFQSIIQDNRYPNIPRLNIITKLFQKNHNTIPMIFKAGTITLQFTKMKQKFQINQEICVILSNLFILFVEIYCRLGNQLQLHGSSQYSSQQLITILQLIILQSCIQNFPKLQKTLKKSSKTQNYKNCIKSLYTFLSTIKNIKNESETQQIKLQTLTSLQQNDGLKQYLDFNLYSNNQQQTTISLIKLQTIQILLSSFKIMLQIKTNFNKYIKILIIQLLRNGFIDVNQNILITKFICLKELSESQYGKIQMQKNGFIYHISEYYKKYTSNLQNLQLTILLQSVLTILNMFKNRKDGIDRNRVIQFYRHKGLQNFIIIYHHLYQSPASRTKKNTQDCILSKKMLQLIKISQSYQK